MRRPATVNASCQQRGRCLHQADRRGLAVYAAAGAPGACVQQEKSLKYTHAQFVNIKHMLRNLCEVSR
jgi:hypothetical protein